MQGKHPNTRQLEPAALAVALAAATTKARSLRRRLKAPPADEDDFQQAILLDLIHRADRFDPDRAVWGAFVSMVTRRQRIAVGSEQSAVLARVWENTAKVALIKAVSANPAAPVIRGVDAQWAREVVDHCVATLLIQAARHLADNEHEANHKKVLRLIDEAGVKGISRTELYRKTHFLGDRREAVLAALIQSEEIEEMSRPTKTKKRTSYRRRLASGGE